MGMADVPDGTPFVVTLSTSNESEKLNSAQIIKESLAQCGVQIEINAMPWEELYAPGPGGPIFGRNFSLAQFAWVSSVEPPCYLYTTLEIPGPYPDFPKGWGGANASGYSNPVYDQVCQNAITSFPGTPEHGSSHFQAQAIFVEDVPSIPLYSRLKVAAMRPDMCEVDVVPSADSSLWSIELFDYGEGCVN
jgi:peptide/nickel transport system substrate-binding protein